MRWHATTRENLIKRGANDNFHPKWGWFLPTQKFNVDQSPLPFAMNAKKTDTEKMWISQPARGLDKRQCSLQICARPEGPQSPIAVIFRGKAKESQKMSDRHKIKTSIYIFPK